MSTSRRTFLTSLAASAATSAFARDWTGQTPERYPDPDVIALEPAFSKYIQGNSPIRRLHTGMLWAEGPAWNGAGNYLVWSDIPNNAQMRYLPEDGHVSMMRNNSGNSNGNTFDWQGRQISCEHANRRVVRYELNGQVTVLAAEFEGKPLNAPNDVVVHPDSGVWFTDPGYGSMGDYEGNKGDLHLKEAVYRIDPGGKIEKVTETEAKPNGLCFSPDYKKLYVVDTGSAKNIRMYDVKEGVRLGEGKEFAVMNEDVSKALAVEHQRYEDLQKELYPKKRGQLPLQDAPGNSPATAPRIRTLIPTPPEKAKELERQEIEERKRIEFQQKVEEHNALQQKIRDWEEPRQSFLTSYTKGQGGSDGIRCDVDGNVWATAGWIGDGYDGVHVFSQEGQRIGFIKLPETGSNLCFGGPKRNRLFITASQSLYSVYVNTNGAHFC